MTENGKSLLFSSTMDFSSLFPVSLLSTPGLHTFKINQLSISQVDNGDEGAFCVADCYIILHAFHETSDDERESSIAHLIFTWIGLQAQLDKRFCAAIYAVGLKSLLVKPCRILRQTQGDETLDFLSLFPTLTYLEATAATESGLYPVQERHFPLLLYKIHGKFDFKLTLVWIHCSKECQKSLFKDTQRSNQITLNSQRPLYSFLTMVTRYTNGMDLAHFSIIA